MDLDCILGVAPKGFDRQVSLDPFEERLNLPPVAVDVGNDKRPEFKVVGKKGTYSGRYPFSDSGDTRSLWV